MISGQAPLCGVIAHHVSDRAPPSGANVRKPQQRIGKSSILNDVSRIRRQPRVPFLSVEEAIDGHSKRPHIALFTRAPIAPYLGR
jgi:hypothetical protein